MSSAPKAKELGNAAFRAGKWDESIGHYTVAILADGSNLTYPLNRAAAYLKLGKNEDAERDCTTVLCLDGTNTKALYRRAQARTAMGKASGAQNDLNHALRLDPSNTTIKSDLEKLLERQSIATSSIVTSTSEAMHRRERIPIAIVDDCSSELHTYTFPAPPLQQQNTKTHSYTTSDGVGCWKGRYTVDSDNNTSVPLPWGPLDQLSPLPSPKIITSPTASSLSSRSGPVAACGPATGPLRSVGGEISHSTSSSSDLVLSGAQSPNVNVNQTPTVRTPSTLFEFTQRWNSVTSSAQKWEIIKSIPLSAVRHLFGQALTPPLVLAIVDCIQCMLYEVSGSLSLHQIATLEARAFVSALPSVDRFSIVVMLLPCADKVKITGLLHVLGVARSAWGL